MSCLLAARYGGTPWQWREQADEMDWGTCMAALIEENERMKEAGYGA